MRFGRDLPDISGAPHRAPPQPGTDAERSMASLGDGEPLDAATRTRMEAAFGDDLGHIRVHSGDAAAQYAAEQGASALAIGADIALGPDAGPPGTLRGDAILAHEIAHALQQDPALGWQGDAVDAAAEHDADRSATAALGSRLAGDRGAARPHLTRGLSLSRCTPKPAAKAGPGATLDLPKELTAGMDTAWKGSFPGGHSMEQGGILVRDKDGKLAWKPATSTTSGSTSYPYGDVGATDTIEAVGHTHPYDASEGGHVDVAFSGADLANMIGSKERMKVVRAGDTTFAAVRTAEFDALWEGKGTAEQDALAAEMKKLWDDTAAKTVGALPVRSVAAATAVCAKYHLLFYVGKGSTLDKVPT